MGPLSSANPWALPLLGLPGLTATPSDVDALGQLLQPFFSPSTLECRSPDGRFANTISGLQIGGAALMAIRGHGLISRGVTTHGVNLVIAYGQPGIFQVDGRGQRVDEQPLLLPLGPYDYWTDHVQGVVVSLDAPHLVQVAMAMAASTSDAFARQLHAALQRPQLLDLTRGRSHQHLACLKHTLALVDQALRAGQGLSPMLALDDQIARLVALLVFPELEADSGADAVQPLLMAATPGELSPLDQRLNQLIAWALAEQRHPLRLSDLEARSGYSRRTLQKAFQRRYGMGPIQWLRRQRLLQAKQLIENSAGQLKLGAIAQSCGYLNLASFSRDFHQVFGEKASTVARRHRDP